MERKEQWRPILDEAYFYAMPNRNPFDMSLDGASMDDELFDMTLANDMDKFVNQTMAALTPQEIDWLELIPGEMVDEDTESEVARKLQFDTDTFFYYMRKSNFDVAVQEAYEDMAISTGIIQVLEGDDDDPLVFATVPNNAVGLECDAFGDLSGVFRDYREMLVDHALEVFGEDIKIPEQVLQGQAPHKMNVYECSYYDRDKKNYKYYLVNPDHRVIMLEKELESWPWIAFRWSKRPGEDRGRGPALKASKTQATINRALADELRSAALKGQPPYMAFHDYVINPWNFKVEPNTIIPVNPLGTETWPIQQLPVGGDITFTAIVINDLRSQIHEIMFTQPLQPLQNEPVRTATEVAIKQAELRDNRGAAYSRVQRELLFPLVKRVIYILAKKGKMKPLVIDGKQVDVSFKTPLVTSKDSNQVKNFVEYFQILSALFTPAVAINMTQMAKLPEWIGRKLNTDLSLIKGEAEIVGLMQEAADAAMGAVEQQQPGPQPLPEQNPVI